MVVYCSQTVNEKEHISGSKSCALVRYEVDKMVHDAYLLLSKFDRAGPNQTFW